MHDTHGGVPACVLGGFSLEIFCWESLYFPIFSKVTQATIPDNTLRTIRNDYEPITRQVWY